MIFATQTQRPVEVFGLPQGVKLLCEAGYPALDLSLNVDKFEELPTKAEQEEAKEIAKSFGVVFNQAHAPFGYQKFVRVFQPEFWRIFEVVSNFGVKQMVVHPLQPGRYYGHEKEIFDLNVGFYRSLTPLAEKYGVKVAIENMWQYNPVSRHIVDDICADPKELADIFDALDDPDHFTVCLDIGHVPLCNREPEDAIKIIGHDRLGALHVHDVDYVNDLHVLPGFGRIKWDLVCRALGEIDYKGDFTLESDNTFIPFEPEFYPTVARFMADRARFLSEKVDSYRVK